jgi:hypothetical protein
MPKRFTDSLIWEDCWYRKLPCEYKELWRFMYERCDHAGIWKKDFETASYYIGKVVNEEKAFKLFNSGKERIWIIKDGEKWFIPQYIEFQYRVLNENAKPHISVIEILTKHGIWQGIGQPLKRPTTSILEPILEQEKAVPVAREEKSKYSDFVILSTEEHKKLLDRFGQKNVNLLIERLNNYIGSHGKKYKSHYFTILNWASKENIRKPIDPIVMIEQKPIEYTKEDLEMVSSLVRNVVKEIGNKNGK